MGEAPFLFVESSVKILLPVLIAASLAQQQPPPKLQPLPIAAPKPSATAPAGPYEFTTDIGAFLIVVRADKAPVFDAAMAKLKQAFAVTTASADRKRQAAGWRVLKSSETPTPTTPAIPAVAAVAATATSPAVAAVAAVPAGPSIITYIFLIDPVAKKTSYDPIEILRELMPNEVQATFDQLKDSWVSATRIGLAELVKMGGS